MITELRVQNFKSWKDTGTLQLAPLTGFFGTNSSGKTGILQTLLMLKQTVERRPEWNEVIDFGDERTLVNLGSFDESIHQHNTDLNLEVGLSWQLPEKRGFDLLTEQANLRYSRAARRYGEKQSSGPFETDALSFAVSIENKKARPVSLNKFSYTSGEHVFEVSRNRDRSGYALGPPYSLSVSQLFRCYGILDRGSTLKDFTPLMDAFESLFHRSYYLGPLREYPRTRYTWRGNHPEGIGQDGSDMIPSILSSRVRLPGIDKQLGEWLQKLDLIHAYSLNPTPDAETAYELLVQKHKNSPKVRLTDVGFGVSQVLPVLVLCHYVPEGSILILEQPEAHLHPKVQSELADLLIAVAKNRKLQIIVESHSEHLLLRLMRRIAEEEISADDTAFYFCDIKDGVSEIEQLEVDAYGNITNWPPDFFGDTTGDLVAKTKHEMERKRIEKEGV